MPTALLSDANKLQSSVVPQMYSVTAYHYAERLRLKEIRDRLGYEPTEFSNYEMVISLRGKDSYLYVYSFGALVFFNVPDVEVEKELNRLKEFRSPNAADRNNDSFLVETEEAFQNKVFFDRVQLKQLSKQSINIVCLLLAQSTTLEYYDNIIEALLEKSGRFSRQLEQDGKFLEGSEDLIKFIGQCLNTKQEIISRLHIVDAPDEIWEDNELEKIFLDLKVMLEIDARYRALEYKIKIIQESIEIIVDLSASRRYFQLEWMIIILIAAEIVMTLVFHFLVK